MVKIQKLILLLLLSLNCAAQEETVGYKDQYGQWQLNYQFHSLANMVLNDIGVYDFSFTCQEFAMNDSGVTVQLKGMYSGSPVSYRIVIDTVGTLIKTAPDYVTSYTICDEVSSCCATCLVSRLGNCYCHSPICGGGCEKRTYGSPSQSISNLIRDYLLSH